MDLALSGERIKMMEKATNITPWIYLIRLVPNLTAGIPVIVPSSLSTAKFIVAQGLGFVADSLEEVHAIVDKMNLQEYKKWRIG